MVLLLYCLHTTSIATTFSMGRRGGWACQLGQETCVAGTLPRIYRAFTCCTPATLLLCSRRASLQTPLSVSCIRNPTMQHMYSEGDLVTLDLCGGGGADSPYLFPPPFSSHLLYLLYHSNIKSTFPGLPLYYICPLCLYPMPLPAFLWFFETMVPLFRCRHSTCFLVCYWQLFSYDEKEQTGKILLQHTPQLLL